MTAEVELGDIIDELGRFPRAAVELVNGALVDAIERQARIDTGGDFILSNAARRGQKRTKLKVNSKVDSSIASATGIVSAAPKSVRAQWAWLDAGTDRHKAPSRHPGTPAKRTITAPVEAVLPRLERRIADRFEIAITR